MDPQEAMMDRAYRLNFPKIVQRRRLVGALEPGHETRQVAMPGRQVVAGFNIVPAPFAGDDRQLLAGLLVGHPQHLRR